jgi:hypothetical protein
MKMTFRDMVWVTILVLVVIWLSKCHQDKIDVADNRLKSITDKAAKDSIQHRKDTIVLNYKLGAFQQEIKVRDSEHVILEAELDKATTLVGHLAQSVQGVRNLTPDTSFVTVSPEYVSFCDSLAGSSEILATDYYNYKLSTGKLLSAKDSALSIKDSLLLNEKTFSAECRKEFNEIQGLYRNVLQENKPRTQFYLGAELIAAVQTPFGDVGAVASIKTKSNKLWQLSSGVQSNGGVYVRVSGNILISFK